MNTNKTVFHVCVADIQSVAEEQYGTQLNNEELAVVIKQVQERIVTYDVIWDAIGQVERISKVEDEENRRFFESYRS
ncbi:MAG: hypothetical protein M1470_11905 [Bacteroidetes bacterium]|nr:hypothetical protein [Bacteroidota bacterium]MCL5738665.1 hypothetical protein [Bacteroidota bacterium]